MTETSKEYASALFELAKETGSEKEFRTAIQTILSELSGNPEYMDLLSSPNIPIRERKSLIEQAFAAHVPEYVLSFTELLCEKGHIHEFDKCANEYDELYKAFESISNDRIISAIHLTDEEKSNLVSKLEKTSGHHVTAQYEIDKTLLGGVVIHMDDNVIDGSLKRKLREVKEVIGK